MKDYYNIFIVLFITLLLVSLTVNKTFAIDYDDSLVISIKYSDNDDRLYNNIYNFIDKNDDLLIGLSSFEMSNILNENYDYLVKYAINYIIDNRKYYNNLITDNHIATTEIYKITDNVFGRNKFYIESNDKIELIKDDIRFDMILDRLNIIEKNNDYVIIVCDYSIDNINMKYKYSLLKKNERLIIENIEVL